MGSIIHQLAQKNEWNKHLSLVKFWVPKLLNLINTKMVPIIKKGECILDISLDVTNNVPLW